MIDENQSLRLIRFWKEDLVKAKMRKINVTKFCREMLHQKVEGIE